MSVLGLIPARAGSKGLPGKNIKLLCGKPLLVYAIEAAHQSGVIDQVLVSTDSGEIGAIGHEAGADTLLRPTWLAQDTTPMLDVVRHALEFARIYTATLPAWTGCSVEETWAKQIIVLLQPTSPLRTPEHIRRAVQMLRESQADSVVSVVPLPLTHSPEYVMRLEDGKLVPFLPYRVCQRRQDVRPAYMRDGTIYTCWRKTVTEQHSLYGAHCLPLILAPSESLSIDTPEDWAEAERRISLP